MGRCGLSRGGACVYGVGRDRGERVNSIMYLEVECSFESCKASLHLQSPKQRGCVCWWVVGGRGRK